MRRPAHLTLLALVALLATLSFVACNRSAETPTPAADSASAATTDISVDELSKALDAKETVTVCDANNEDTRKQYGVIPGAVLLTSYEGYDMSILPSNKDASVVFYCGGEKCSAAPKAAEKAVAAGYTKVRVLRAGIKGWTEAGKPTEKADDKG